MLLCYLVHVYIYKNHSDRGTYNLYSQPSYDATKGAVVIGFSIFVLQPKNVSKSNLNRCMWRSLKVKYILRSKPKVGEG